MFRWKFIIPRLLLLGGLMLFAWLAMNPLLRWAMICGGQAATGAKVDISALRTLLSRAELQLSSVALADPQSPMRNLFEAKQAVLDVDMAELLRRRLVVNEGSVRGIQLGTTRQVSGALPGGTELTPNDSPWLQGATSAGEHWLEAAAEKLGTGLESDLESVTLSRELVKRWPQEFQVLESDVTEIRELSEHLLDSVRKTKLNPVQSIEHYQRLMADIDAVRRDTLAMRQRFSQLSEQIRRDQVAIRQAKQHDEQYVRQRLKLARLDPEAISSYLLGPEMGPHVSSLIDWLQWGRQLLPATSGAAAPATRGWNLVLPGTNSGPSLLVRQLMLDGGGSANGQPFSFRGSLQGFTSEPGRYGKPAVLNVATEGAVGMTMHVVLDHTTELAKEKIVIECPRLVQHGRVLGSADKLAVTTAPGSAQLRIHIDFTGNQLDGRIHFRQPSVELSTSVGDKLGGSLVAERLSTATSAIDELDAAIRLGGTLRKPDWKIESNLGNELAAGLQHAFSRELEQRQQQLIARAHSQIDQQLSRVEQEINLKQNELLAKLNLDGSQLDIINSEIAQFCLPGKLLGEDGLLREIFRR